MYARFQLGAYRQLAARAKTSARAGLRLLAFESLEDRRLLAVSASSTGGVLSVTLCAASDTATISANGAATSIQVVGGTFNQTFASTTALSISYGSTSESVTFNGTTAIAVTGALTVSDAGNSAGETLTFANTTTYSFGSVGVWTSTTASVGSVAVNDSLAATAGTLTIGTGSATTSPALTFGGTGTVSAASGDIDLSSSVALAIATPLSDSAGAVRLVTATGISETSTITSNNLSGIATAGNIVLEGANAVAGTVAFSAAAGSVSFNDASTAVINGATTTAGTFAAVTGTTATSGDANLKIGGTLSINSPITASTGSVRLVAAGSITQAIGGVITASSLSLSNATAGSAILESANVVSTLATKNSVAAVPSRLTTTQMP